MASRVLITAGPTHEPIDSVRYIANRSSGRAGIAIAEAAARRGLETTLLLGPVPREPSGDVAGSIRVVRFTTTSQLRSLLHEHWPTHDVLVMAAAVADYRPATPPGGIEAKRPRGQRWTLALEPTPDLVAELAGSSRPDQVLIGFALEPAERLIEAARRKLERKHLDAIVANPLETMGSDRIEATLILADGTTRQPPGRPCTKEDFAVWLLDQLGKGSESLFPRERET